MTTTKIKTIDCVLTWEYAVKVYIEVLRNPDAGSCSLQSAKDELLRLARIADTFGKVRRNH
jgi:hypothetical protein